MHGAHVRQGAARKKARGSDYLGALLFLLFNWSHRRRWRRALAVLVFRYFGGHREFNPMAVVFRPFRRAKTFRFYASFRDFKHGETEAVPKMEQELYELLDEIVGRRAA